MVRALKLSDAGDGPAAVLLRFNHINEGIPAADGNENSKWEALCAFTLEAHPIWGLSVKAKSS